MACGLVLKREGETLAKTLGDAPTGEAGLCLQLEPGCEEADGEAVSHEALAFKTSSGVAGIGSSGVAGRP